MTLPSGSVMEVGRPRSSRVQVVVSWPVVMSPPPVAFSWLTCAADRTRGYTCASRACPSSQSPCAPAVLALPTVNAPWDAIGVASVALPASVPFTYRVMAPVLAS